MPVIETTPLSGSSIVSGTSTLSTNFKNLLFQFLETKGIEGLKPYVYNDNKGIPTLGVGYALVIYRKDLHKWIVRPSYLANFDTAKIKLGSTQLQSLQNDLADAAAYLNDPKGGAANPFKQDSNILHWTITSTQAQALFDVVADGYVQNVQAWLGSSTAGQAAYNALFNGGAGSRELIALASQAYNGPALISPGHSPSLRTAILDGNRAEAWYQIRYQDPSPAERRYAEAAMFGLYQGDGSYVSEADALQIYQMCTTHSGKKGDVSIFR